MPYLHVRLGTGAASETTRPLASMLTDLTHEVLAKKREMTAISVEHIGPRRWFIGGEPIDATDVVTFQLDIKVTQGTNTGDEKSAYVARAFEAVQDLLGPLHPASYVVIHEVDADAWGYQGRTQGDRARQSGRR